MSDTLLLQEEHGGAGVYSADLRKGYRLKSDEWKYDILPEIIEGRNVLDFVDADIEARLEALEREEDALAAAAALEARHGCVAQGCPCDRGLQHARCVAVAARLECKDSVLDAAAAVLGRVVCLCQFCGL